MIHQRNISGSFKKCAILSAFIMVFLCSPLHAQDAPDIPKLSFRDGSGLSYLPDRQGNRIPDFSYCGYHSSDVPIPDLPVGIVVPVPDGDATDLLQSAIDYVASLSAGPDGFRGVILLEPGIYRLKGRLKVNASGIVIRGSGMNERGTIILAEGDDRKTLISISGTNDRQVQPANDITDDYVPVNAFKFTLTPGHRLNPGDKILVHRPSTQDWIDILNMNEFGGETTYLGWKPGERDISWDRTVTAVEGDLITIDAPLTVAIDKIFGGGRVIPYTWHGRISHTGIENLLLRSEYDPANAKDESHCWMAITFEHCENSWIRQVRFEHFAGSAVAVYETARKITVKDCISEAPVSEIGGQRRYTFFNMGQQCLFKGIYSENGYHDFAVGFCAAGPNAYVECESKNSISISGAIDSWASGVLFDIVNIDGNRLSYKNRGQDAQGAGWCAANSMFWQCTASLIDCYKPPTANNWAYGSWAQYAGDGYWEGSNNHVSPRSLFYAQLAQRLNLPVESFRNEFRPALSGSTTSPTPDQAEELNIKSFQTAFTVKDYVLTAPGREPISTDRGHAAVFEKIPSVKNNTIKSAARVEILNGVIIYEGRAVSGGRRGVPWWRGNARPFAAQLAAPAVTRFVPGRYGDGYTDDLDRVCKTLITGNIVALEHNYGLWYDRRRDDHQRIRRMDGEVWPPFYEQPFARSGEGIAWDGLSKYDLTKFNPWYWNRLKEFTDIAEDKGILLIHHNYFQHNILEAGAHYADFPWRTANNINSTGFPEPPNYAGDKRIFMDEQFYDVEDSRRRDLHRKYIRKCLDNFASNSNVIQLTSAEYTGPLHFVEFWLDVIAEWEDETGNDALVALSATKDVQDSILADSARSGIVDIIDIRYWGYRPGGSLYAPEGGRHLAPRQHARLEKPGSRGMEEVYRAVKEYRLNFPDKAVIYSERSDLNLGWAVAMAGGSLPDLPPGIPEEFLADLATMKPVADHEINGAEKILRNNHGNMIIHYNSHGVKVLDLTGIEGRKHIEWIDPVSGSVIADNKPVRGGGSIEIKSPGKIPIILWLH